MVTNVEILSHMAKRHVTPVISCGVYNMNLNPFTLMRMHEMAIKRWSKNPKDDYTKLTPQGINIDIFNRNEKIDTMLILEFPTLSSPVLIKVDDCGPDSTKGLLVSIILPDED